MHLLAYQGLFNWCSSYLTLFNNYWLISRNIVQCFRRNKFCSIYLVRTFRKNKFGGHIINNWSNTLPKQVVNNLLSFASHDILSECGFGDIHTVHLYYLQIPYLWVGLLTRIYLQFPNQYTWCFVVIYL